MTSEPHRLWAPDPELRDRGDVRAMFEAVSPRYDLLNRLLSLGQDGRWRRRARLAAEITAGERVLDVATGTADLALTLAAVAPGTRVTGIDFCVPMLKVAKRKLDRRRDESRIALAAGDALRLPFRDSSFDVVSVGFGVRNFQDLGAGLAEMRRVLKPGGRVVILEFSTPETRLQRWLTGPYLRIVPLAGRVISRSGTDAYRYLAESIRRFPGREAFACLLGASGFVEVRSVSLMLGLVAIHVARR